LHKIQRKFPVQGRNFPQQPLKRQKPSRRYMYFMSFLGRPKNGQTS
jgi:hypothetical protein